MSPIKKILKAKHINPKSYIPQSIFKNVFRPFKLLKSNENTKIIIFTIIQFFVGFLDFIGVILISLIGTFAVNFSNQENINNIYSKLLKIMNLQGFLTDPSNKKLLILSSIAILLLLSRTVLSILFTKHILIFMSQKSAEFSTKLFRNILHADLLILNRKNKQELLFFATKGVEIIFLQIAAPLLVLISDIFLLTVLIVGLFTVNPFTAITSLLFFGTTTFIMSRFIHRQSTQLGEENSKLNILSNENFIESLYLLTTIRVRNDADSFTSNFSNIRDLLSKNNASFNFLPLISKYFIEVLIIVSTVFIGVLHILVFSEETAFASLIFYFATITRIAPAVLRIQQNIIQIKGSVGQSNSTFELLEEFGYDESNTENKIWPANTENINNFEAKSNLIPSVILNNVSFDFSPEDHFKLNNLNLRFESGKLVAIVGPSGAGKSTLVNLILGLFQATDGEILVAGMAPTIMLQNFPGYFGYVPQDIYIKSGTVRENILLGSEKYFTDEKLLEDIIEKANLFSLVNKLPNKLDTVIGPDGVLLSGGEKQRIAIARSLITNPRILVFDEATSALDGENEIAIVDTLNKLKNETLIIVVAHRLTIVQKADMVVYLESGVVKSFGTVQEVRNKVPNFDSQIKASRID